jgi:hypothetical protein
LRPRLRKPCSPKAVSCRGKISHKRVAESRCSDHRGNKTRSSEKAMIQGQRGKTEHKRTNLCDHERLDCTSVGDMGSNTQVDHRSTAVYSSRRPIGNLGLNKISLIFVILRMHHRQRPGTTGYCSSLLTWNMSSNFSFETRRRSNFWRSLMALSAIFSS